MVRMIRTLLIWLLALALPAQGVLAATTVFCGPSHHAPASGVAVDHHADAAQQLQDSAAHSNQAATDARPENMAADDTATPDKFAQSGMQKCSVCASCCSAAAIHDTAAKLPVVETMAADFAALAPAVEPFAPDGPDRPPRHIPA
ncbi:MAG TPA: hypothetical protein PLO41_10380 [Rubrivivax sp.]|nr:hypothetical protein [Rubrivivax sp.]